MLFDPFAALALIALFTGSVALGAFVRRHAPAEHRTKDSIELIGSVMSLLVTFAAIVLGLLTTSVKADYDTADHDRVRYAAQLTQLDRCLRNYGPGAEEIRANLRSYTAAVIASTWVNEPKPKGVDYPDTTRMPRVGPVPVLADLMNDIGVDIRKLSPTEPLRERIAEDCAEVYRGVQTVRWAVIEDVYATMPVAFFSTVTLWMAIVFAGFGFRAPLNASIGVTIGLAIVAVTSALVIVIDLNQPYGGLFSISSQSMRAALTKMSAP